MANKTTAYPNYSINYNIGGVPGQQTEPKPRMLIISSVPDDAQVVLRKIDHRNGGVDIKMSGGLRLPTFEDIAHKEIVLGGLNGSVPEFPEPDFAFNRTCDPDANKKGLELTRQIVDKHNIQVLNPPEKILATRRDILYQRFANHDGVIVPKTIRIAPSYCKDVKVLLEQGETSLPCIFRPAGGHNSRGVYLIKELGDTNELERFAFDGRDYYLSEMYDCRDSDGLYRKFRVVYVDGKIYPRHFFVSDSWCVDGKTKFTEEKYYEEEIYFLENFQSYLGEEVMSRLQKFCESIDLDFFGVDLNLRPDGKLIVFEANACMAVFGNANREYLIPFINDIHVATKKMLLRFYNTVKSKG